MQDQNKSAPHIIDDPETLEALQRRLRRIEGQVRGIEKMLGDGRDCRDVVQQISAVRSAVHRVWLEVMRTYAHQCLTDPDASGMDDEAVLEYLFSTIARWT
ncbi:MAG: metal-sensitive transcriptional regulator [Anaerolineae bacterium]